MKRISFILLVLFTSITSFAQTGEQYLGSPKVTVHVRGKLVVDSGITPQRVYRCNIMGQSNALGIGHETDLYLPPLNKIPDSLWKKFDRVYVQDDTGNYHQFVPGSGNYNSANDARFLYPFPGTPLTYHTFGAELGIAYRWISQNPTGLLFIDKTTGDGQAITYFQKGTATYTHMLAKRAVSNTWLANHGYKAEDAFTLLNQGENGTLGPYASYSAALDSEYTNQLKDGLIDSNTKIVIAQVGTASGAYNSTVASEKLVYAARNSNVRIITPWNLYNTDGIHYNAVSQLQQGYDAFWKGFSTNRIILDTTSTTVTTSSFPTAGLVGYWALENMTDGSGNSFTLTNHNSATIVSSKVNNGAAFTATSSQYLSGSTSNTLSAGTGLTVAAWVRVNGASPGSQAIVSKYRASGNNIEYVIYMGAGNMNFIVSPDGSSISPEAKSLSFPTDNTWHYVVGVWDGTTVKVYVDNTVGGVTASTSVAKSNGTAPFEIGADCFSPLTTYFLNGGVDEVGVWNRALTTSELTYLYNSGTGGTYP